MSLLGVVAVLILVVANARSLSPGARSGRALLADLAKQDIVSVRFEPASYKSVLTAPVEITDREQVAEFARAMSRMSEFQPNHPSTSRSVVVIITFRNRVVGGELHDGSNGTLFYYYSEIDRGWVYGTYHVPDGRSVFALIARLSAPRVE